MSKRNAAVRALGEKARRLGTAGRRLPGAVKVNTQILELDPDDLPALTKRGLSVI